jgi:DNA (cytosine-5)-methyltransferase 1
MNVKNKYYKNDSQKEYDITEEKREWYREISQASREAKAAAEKGLLMSNHPINKPRLDNNSLMPQLERNNIHSLSLFSGGGGLDLGFDKAGYIHEASYELIPICGETLQFNRPNWKVFAGESSGDVTKVDWKIYKDKVDIIHGGPPCQPFSIAGQQKGMDDHRNMWPEFNRAVNTIKPKAFVAENVLGLLNPKFSDFVKNYILNELKSYHIKIFEMHAADFGVPQIRRRVFFVGFRDKDSFKNYQIPSPTHSWKHLVDSNKNVDSTLPLFDLKILKTMGDRKSVV